MDSYPQPNYEVDSSGAEANYDVDSGAGDNQGYFEGQLNVQLFKFDNKPFQGKKAPQTDDALKMSEELLKLPLDQQVEKLKLTDENIVEKRQQIEAKVKAQQEIEKDFFDQYLQQVNITYEQFAARDGANIKLIVYKPKTLKSTSAAAYVYAHGGSGIFTNAEMYSNIMAVTCINLNCIVISVDFRNGPEVKCPTGQQDFADAFAHIYQNFEKFGIENGSICVAGTGGGAWIVTGALNQMIKEDNIYLPAALFIHSGMLSNECGRISENMLEAHENLMGQPAKTQSDIYKMHATDYNNQQNDDQLYPGKVDEAILEKYPSTVIWTSEFDVFRRDNEAFGHRLQSVNRLEEISKMPGVMHGYHLSNFNSAETKQFLSDERLAFKQMVDH